MALINVAINFGYENFCSVVYFVKGFFQKFCSKNFIQLFFSKFFFFEGFTRWLPVYRDKTDSMYLCYEKYDIQQAVEIGL